MDKNKKMDEKNMDQSKDMSGMSHDEKKHAEHIRSHHEMDKKK